MNTQPESKVAIITGSATGVGAATAIQLAQQGWRVTVNYSRSAPEAQQTVERCQKASHKDNINLVQADIGELVDCKKLVQETLAKFGRIDALVNNAAITVFSSWDKLTAEDFHKIYQVNVVGAFQLSRLCAPHLIKSQGCIVNVSSIAGLDGVGSSFAYAASKGALNTLTLSLARELGPHGVRVNAVCPGFITGRWIAEGIGSDRYERAKRAHEAAVPLRRVCDPADVARAVCYFVTDANLVTGELARVDGGQRLLAVSRL
eukprot:TRINITY_DN843_c0_g2_i1.p2 TRINITY_DN843_c0_g2~~TRINITY_DN843_c0_g2_i1.p2  ORF type:complete len:261 (+),score=36.79 TRINITY_DN843_c0_g2_i1:1168-1950(+)